MRFSPPSIGSAALLLLAASTTGTANARAAPIHDNLRVAPPEAQPAVPSLEEERDYDRRRRRHATKGRAQRLQADSALGDVEGAHLSQKPNGDESCPCLSASSLVSDGSLSNETAASLIADGIDPSSYGVGCYPHDAGTAPCQSAGDCVTVAPLPAGCDLSWCSRPWCYVDIEKCALLTTPSGIFVVDNNDDNKNGTVEEGSGGRRGKVAVRHYSYATCGYMDIFTWTERLNSVRNHTLRVALNANTGGWKGAYNPSGSFATDDQWEGPTVEFVKRAAIEGGFAINLTSPPDKLKERSGRFFGSSSFDYCVYAAALGYVDLCVASYTVTDKRASVTPFFEMDDDPVYLFIFQETDSETTLESFRTAFLTVFRPFTLGSWLMIMLFCLPVLGLLMFYHEYGAPGSAYPRTCPVMVERARGGGGEDLSFETRKIPLWKHSVNSVYMGVLSFFQESYNQPVVTRGGKVNLLAIQALVLLVLNVYTANLAAILTDDIAQEAVEGIESAVKAGYNFCSERKVASTVMSLYNIDPKLIVPDPVDLGGDGQPGFNCPTCGARERVFDYMRREHDDGSLYCNAAIASWEDLQVLHASGAHCDKTRVGEVLVKKTIGLPLFEGVSAGLTALLYQVKNDGILAKEFIAAAPVSQCPEAEEQTSSLNIQDLTGIWMFSFSFAALALVAKLLVWCDERRRDRSASSTKVKPLQRYDQWGNPTAHDIVIDGRKFDPDEVRELHDMKGGSSVLTDNEGQDAGNLQDLTFTVERSDSDVCARSTSIMHGTFAQN